MMKKRSQFKIIAAVIALTTFLFAVMIYFKPTAPVEKLEDLIEKIEAMSAKKQDVFPIVSTQAVVESRHNIYLKSQVTGQVVYTSPNFLTGGFFDTGDVILKIDPSDYELALVQAEVNVAKAQQALSVEKEQADLARLDWEKYGQGKASDLVLRIPQLKEAEAGLKGAQANYETQNIKLKRTQITAPFPLMIGDKKVDLGQVVSNNQDLAGVFGTEEAEIRMPLSQTQIDLLNVKSVGFLSEDEVLEVNVRDLTRDRDIVWQAKIFRIESSIDRKSRVYYAIGTIMDPMNLNKDKATPPLLPGVFVDLQVLGPKIENVYKVPIKAMRDDNNIFIFEDNKLITKPVKVLDRDEKFFTIISGIEEGDYICVSPPFSYVPGMKSQLASLDGVPMGARARSNGASSANRSAAMSTKTQPGPKDATKDAAANTKPRPNRANMTPEQRTAAKANRQATRGGTIQ